MAQFVTCAALSWLLVSLLFLANPSRRNKDGTFKALPRWVKAFNIIKLIDTFRDRPPIRFFYEKIFVNGNIDLVTDEFETQPDYRAECPKNYEDDDINLSLGLLTAKAVFARRMIQHPDFATRYLPLARACAEHVANADYGCLANRFPAEFVARTKAESLRVFALQTLAKIAARKAVGTSYASWVVQELRLADAALKFALTTTSGHASPAIRELRDELEVFIKKRGRRNNSSGQIERS